jgi:serine protease AprX
MREKVVLRMSRLVAALLALALALPAAASAQVGASTPAGPVRAASGSVAVIVQAPGAEAAVAATVRRLGGAVTTDLPIVGGFAATLPADALDEIRAHAGVRAVTPDAAMAVTSAITTTSTTGEPVFRREIGADALADQGLSGAGVRVALIDTGVSSAAATTGDLAGRVVPVADPMRPPTVLRPTPPQVPCVDFSGEGTCEDTFGHGTFMAGLIAGDGRSSGGRHAGVAPGAEIVSVKVGGRDGSADVSKVLAGIQWVVSFADVYGIKVLNLSLGTDSTVAPSIDPLNLAVQRAWVSGITVVVSAGNFGRGPRTAPDGTTFGTVTKPGDDPFVITVGAVDDRETPAISDDRLPLFSSWGPTAHGEAKPDVVAPGARVVSLRAPGSAIDALPGLVDATYRRGSGTSMAAAVTSGLAALLLEARDGRDGRPAWRPDDVKAALVAGAQKVNTTDPRAVGAGLVHGPSALRAAVRPTYRTSVLSDGSGTLDGSRGTNRVDGDPCGLLTPPERCGSVDGASTAQGNNWQGGQYASSEWTPETWYESQWVGRLSGNNWQATTWSQGNNWQGNNWQGSTWGGQTDDRSYGTQTKGSGSYGSWG